MLSVLIKVSGLCVGSDWVVFGWYIFVGWAVWSVDCRLSLDMKISVILHP